MNKRFILITVLVCLGIFFILISAGIYVERENKVSA